MVWLEWRRDAAEGSTSRHWRIYSPWARDARPPSPFSNVWKSLQHSWRPTWMRSSSLEPSPPWASRWSACGSYATRWLGKRDFCRLLGLLGSSDIKQWAATQGCSGLLLRGDDRRSHSREVPSQDQREIAARRQPGMSHPPPAQLNVAPSEVYGCLCSAHKVQVKPSHLWEAGRRVSPDVDERNEEPACFLTPPPPVLDKCTPCLWATWPQRWTMGCFTSSFTTATPRAVEGRWCWTAWATPSGY